MQTKKIFVIFTIAILVFFVTNIAYATDEDTRNILKQGLLGAGVGAISSGASGGNAGTGALIGAGTGVIGGALLDALTAPPASSRRSAPQQQYYNDDEYYPDEQGQYYEEPPQESGTQKVLKQGLLGAGVGAISAGASGGSAGKGALIGAGTNVIGGALLDAITTPSQPRRVYRRAPTPSRQQPQQQNISTQQYEEDAGGAPGTRKKVIRKYDDTGKVISEEETYY